MTFKLAPEHDAAAIARLAKAGAVAAKYYPRGATTHSEDGIEDLRALYPALEALEAHDLVLCMHGEDASAFCLDRERLFLPRLEELVRSFPGLRIVLEHVSTAAGVCAVSALPRTVGGTITAHHLMLTLDDLIGGSINPHLFCKPVVNTPADRAALREAATAAQQRFFFGSDSAPHPRTDKEGARGAAGVYTTPVAVALLAELFEQTCGSEKNDVLGHETEPLWVRRLRGFLCENGADFYRLPRAAARVVLEPADWTVPQEYHGVVPLYAGERLRWRARRV